MSSFKKLNEKPIIFNGISILMNYKSNYVAISNVLLITSEFYEEVHEILSHLYVHMKVKSI